MDTKWKIVMQLAAVLTATLVIPFYVGLLHWPPGRYILYSSAAGLALAAGDFLDTEPVFRESLGRAGEDAVLRAGGVLFGGGVVYLFARLI